MGLPVLDILDAGGNGVDPCSVDPAFCPTTSISNPGPEIAGVCNLGQSFENGVCNGCAGTNHRKVQLDSVYFSFNNNGDIVDKNRWESKIVYQPLGLWFSMISKLAHRTNAPYTGSQGSNGYGGTVRTDSKTDIKMKNLSEYNFRKRCKNRQVGTENAGNGYSNDEKKEYRFYNGTRCLKDYCITSSFGIYEYQGRNSAGAPIYNQTPTEWALTLKSY